MLNEESRHRVETLQKIVSTAKEHLSIPPLSAYDMEWLVNTLIEMDDKYKEHEDCCLHEADCKVGEELTPVACPHNYTVGDHHWYHCMGVNPFEEAIELKLEIDRLKGNA